MLNHLHFISEGKVNIPEPYVAEHLHDVWCDMISDTVNADKAVKDQILEPLINFLSYFTNKTATEWMELLPETTEGDLKLLWNTIYEENPRPFKSRRLAMEQAGMFSLEAREEKMRRLLSTISSQEPDMTQEIQN
jgi:hypothetical protein